MISLTAIIILSTFYVASGWYYSLLVQSVSKVERFGLSFLLGSGISTMLWFLGYRLGMPFNLGTLLLSGALTLLLGFSLSKYSKSDSITFASHKFTRTEKYMALAIIIALALALLIGSYNPLTAWDSIALYDFRGHAIALNHNLKDIIDQSYYVSYPLMISLVHAALYMLGGINAQGIHAVFFASFIAVVYGRMKVWTNDKYALLTSLLIIFQNEIYQHSTFAYTNLPYTILLVSGLLYAATPSLLLSGILIGLSTWMRSSEVFWILGIILIIWQGIRTKKYALAVSSIVIIFAFRLIWSSFLSQVLTTIGQPASPRINYFTINALQIITSKLSEIMKYLYLNVVSPYLGIWFLSIPMLLVSYLKKNLRLFMFTSTSLISAGMVTVGVMIFSTYYESWNQIGDSARRMMLFVIPLNIIASVYALYLMSKKDHDEK